MRIAVASANQLKISAAKNGFLASSFSSDSDSSLTIKGFSTDSNISEQPISVKLGFLGASHRLSHLSSLAKKSSFSFDLFISFENTIDIRDGKAFDICCCIVEHCKSGVRLSFTGHPTPLPMSYVHLSLSTNFSETCGSFIHKENPNIPASNWMSHFGGIDRVDDMSALAKKAFNEIFSACF
mmetsp:Transcript_10665/g.15614  ORF Transcript_10665/g.15614 Transcript_10665/m.15614 type:complete len:182 (+) Transcript_10665:40-585(+)